MHLGSNIPDFTATVYLKDMIRGAMQLSIDAPFVYQIICSCDPTTIPLNESDISIKNITYISPKSAKAGFKDWIEQDVHTKTSIGVVSQGKLKTSITDEVKAYYGFRQYDDQYLYYWDDYTVYDMSAEIVNQA